MAQPRRPARVFVSYAHEDRDHLRSLEVHLSALRRQWIVETWDDRQIDPGADWETSIDEALRGADVVLLLVSPHFIASDFAYGRELAQALDRRRDGETQVLPVFVRPCDIEGTALASLQGVPSADRPIVSWPDPDLAWTEVSRAVRRAIGASEATGDPLPAGDVATAEFSPSIRDRMAELRGEVSRLTEQQLRVIRQLGGTRRVLISGCAGSGKTLVAAEKAIRLGDAGLQTLFLCHNPLLADHVRSLVGGSAVTVADFGSWVDAVVGRRPSPQRARWSNYEEPSPEVVEGAFDELVERGPHWDAVIVDEGQDFRDHWWVVVEAALRDPTSGILYIFHDDGQALLPHRSRYPFTTPVLDLSRNCRNAGAVYELVRVLHPGSPLAEQALEPFGDVMVVPCPPGGEASAARRALDRLWQQGWPERVVALLGGHLTPDRFALAGAEVALGVPWSWRAEVLRRFDRILGLTGREHRSGVTLRGSSEEVHADLARLGDDAVPTPADVQLVRDVASRFSLASERHHRHLLDHERRIARVKWAVVGDRLKLRKPTSSPADVADFVVFFSQPDWADGIPSPTRIPFLGPDEPAAGPAVRVYPLAAWKGLEADAVLLFHRGLDPSTDEQLYVGASRAIWFLAVLPDHATLSAYPALAARAGWGVDPRPR